MLNLIMSRWTRDESVLKAREKGLNDERAERQKLNLDRQKRERSRRKLYAQLYEPHQCVKELPNGEQCVKFAIPGGFFCIHHGGNDRAAREAAKMRLLAMVEPAFRVMLKAMASDDLNIALKAAIAIADRAGFKPGADLNVVDQAPEDISKLDKNELLERAHRTMRRLHEMKSMDEVGDRKNLELAESDATSVVAEDKDHIH